ncbi:restriction endonuclease subunit S [Corynebacterium halotolerans]|nr:restriction endonuclease subunit S [Corynebacterium halotolerans]
MNEPSLRLDGFIGEWKEGALGDLGSVRGGGTPATGISAYWGGKIPWFTPGEISENGSGIVADSERLITSDGLIESSAKELPPGTVLVTSRASIGHVAVTSKLAATNQGFASVTPNQVESTWFIYNWVLAHQDALRRSASGSTFLEISVKSVENFPITYPNLPEQEILGGFFRKFDSLIDSADSQVSHLKHLKQTMLGKMFPRAGETVPGIRFDGFDGEWSTQALGQLGSTYGGLTGKNKDDFGHGEARYITYRNVFSNAISDPEMVERVEVDPVQNEVRIGDVLFTTSSETPEEVGMSSVVTEVENYTYLNSFCFGYRPTAKFDLYFLASLLRSDSVRNQLEKLAQGISRFNISSRKVMAIEVAYPSVQEQQVIGNYFRKLDQLIELEENKLSKLQHLKSAFLDKMFV